MGFIKNKQNLITGAEVFFQWVNKRMMSMIFELVKDNYLLPIRYDGDGVIDFRVLGIVGYLLFILMIRIN